MSCFALCLGYVLLCFMFRVCLALLGEGIAEKNVYFSKAGARIGRLCQKINKNILPRNQFF
jgi:hypothetical protein